MRVFQLLLVVLLLGACSDNQKIPKNILPPEKMQAVYWDYIQTDVFANQFVRRDTSQSLDSAGAMLQAQVFKFHKITKDDFYRSYNYYLDHKELMREMLDTMIVRQNAISKAASDSLLAPNKDSTGIFPDRNKRDTIKIE